MSPYSSFYAVEGLKNLFGLFFSVSEHEMEWVDPANEYLLGKQSTIRRGPHCVLKRFVSQDSNSSRASNFSVDGTNGFINWLFDESKIHG